MVAVVGTAAVLHNRDTGPVAPAAFTSSTAVPAVIGNGMQETYPSSFNGQSSQTYVVPQTAQNEGYADGYYSGARRPVYVRQRTVERERPVVVERDRVYDNGPVYTSTQVRHGRTKTHSAEIVAGTAGVGAAIGAIAGGGKGAALGGISGAGAGFVYDRLTHNHP